jgi:protocatechuate 3,4-dioxygenase beta subunit
MSERRKPDWIAIDRRVPRRIALQGLGALALTGIGCSSERKDGQGAPNDMQTMSGSGGAAPVVGSGGAAAPATGASQPVMPPAGGSAGTMPNTPGTGGSAPPAPDSGMPALSMKDAGGMVAPDAGMHDPGATDLDALQCIVTPAMTDGPFFVDEKRSRSNLVMGESDAAVASALPLSLVIGVFEVNGTMCTPLSGVQVDIWQANAVGVYSDIAPGVIQSVDTTGKQFLRGYQMTDDQGIVRFETIYPGWYMSRTIHIHFKLRMISGTSASEFTSQMFFDEAINAMVLAKPPYSSRSDTRSVLNDDDHIYNGTAMNGQLPPAGTTPPGKQIMPVLVESGTGYTATLKIGVQA